MLSRIFASLTDRWIEPKRCSRQHKGTGVFDRHRSMRRLDVPIISISITTVTNLTDKL